MGAYLLGLILIRFQPYLEVILKHQILGGALRADESFDEVHIQRKMDYKGNSECGKKPLDSRCFGYELHMGANNTHPYSLRSRKKDIK